jgi:hypothetical protein
MSGARDTKAARPKAVVERCYHATPESCADAVAFLLQSLCKQEKTAERLPSPDDRNDGPKSKEDSADAAIIREL